MTARRGVRPFPCGLVLISGSERKTLQALTSTPAQVGLLCVSQSVFYCQLSDDRPADDQRTMSPCPLWPLCSFWSSGLDDERPPPSARCSLPLLLLQASGSSSLLLSAGFHGGAQLLLRLEL